CARPPISPSHPQACDEFPIPQAIPRPITAPLAPRAPAFAAGWYDGRHTLTDSAATVSPAC
ncbi:MAG: hypothetical protein ACK5YX_07765, partial [Planctomyces sp.]